MENYQNIALALNNKGYQCIPLNPSNNTPCYTFKNIDITPSVIKHMNWSNKRIGILCRGVYIIDIDTHNLSSKDKEELKQNFIKNGLDYIYQLPYGNKNLGGYSTLKNSPYFEEVIDSARSSYVEVTKSGGLHIILKKQNIPEITYSQKIDVFRDTFGNGIDIKAHDNNYCAIAPSSGYTSIIKGQIDFYHGNLENNLFNNISERQAQLARELFPEITTKFYQSSRAHSSSKAYRRLLSGKSTSRNNDLFKATCFLLENNLSLEPLEVIVGTVNEAGDIFSEAEFIATVKSAYRTYNNKSN
ncbi:bifunctional DNA primase/polymerase [Lactococcus lactis]|uniref:bifunctional DNA primase/polymerase n=1 Tax=Lactococcus lactis TaxID=1358 RepID=UPI00071DFD95|nr:bifunctional DNA primase/polymerase [Lactococcus lactis]KSU00192.1 hypothetical protein KF196_0194 [Lactococcus lactis subsp. lactis]